ncbi:hypothetical protein K0M31_005779 [Melipona bicolor]|uniref:Uncharacterized protein n=1 Tax=Melipona bicolor TaxID=60889 RepID=A0AA40FU22_9HYME|nr:hypothetical protein K0M31_005779 [Melipona bicolor]
MKETLPDVRESYSRVLHVDHMPPDALASVKLPRRQTPHPATIHDARNVEKIPSPPRTMGQKETLYE